MGDLHDDFLGTTVREHSAEGSIDVGADDLGCDAWVPVVGSVRLPVADDAVLTFHAFELT